MSQQTKDTSYFMKNNKNSQTSKSNIKKIDQDSLLWYTKTAASIVTNGVIDRPKTIRSSNYRSQFLKKNPGLLGGKYICVYCGKKISKSEMQVDHIRPLDKGGRNEESNYAPA